MHSAIRRNDDKFVRLLLEKSFIDLQEFLTVGKLLELYSDVRLKLCFLIYILT